jgi:Golgi nucleoside diphosphatase
LVTNVAQYGVILDAGSSGTRLYVYKWKNPARNQNKTDSEDLHRLPKLKLKTSKKIHPGVSTFSQTVASVGNDHLQELVDVALAEIPKEKIPETPIFLLATAGVRFLPKPEQTALLEGICTWLKSNTQFELPDCGSHIKVISGETEGLYGWIAANYLLGGFDHPEGEDQKAGQNHHHTYGFLDMGGASAQIAFAPNSTEAEKHANDLKLVRMRHLDGTPAEYRVFTTTWLGFGANKARDRYIESLKEEFDQNVNELPDPCLPRGLRTTLEGEILASDAGQDGKSLIGTGDFSECLRKTHPLLGKDAPCNDDPCLLNGQHVPAIDFDTNHFVGVSEYWHTTHGVFGDKKDTFDLDMYQKSVKDYCTREWASIEHDLEGRSASPNRKAVDARQACFKASWLINMLYEGIGIPRIGLESGHGSNHTHSADHDQEGAFRPVNKIDDVELSWTLGKMVLYASGQVPAEGTPLPVGIGSNVESGTPVDFEEAGSVPLLPAVDGHEDDDDNLRAPSNHWSGLAAVIFLLILAGLLLRKPERRRKLMNIARRRRSSSSRRPVRTFPGMSLANKLLGRHPHAYERVMEEGDVPEFELGGGDSDDDDSSETSEGNRAGVASGLTTPRLTAFHDDLRPPSAFDRQGLSVRTDSRERIANVGRRSRAASPQRQKSSIMSPIEQEL